MLASILFLSPNGQNLLEGAAPSLPAVIQRRHQRHRDRTQSRFLRYRRVSGRASFRDRHRDRDPLRGRTSVISRFITVCVPAGRCRSAARKGQVLGTFANYYREPKSPTERDMEVISMVAQTASIAIERYRREKERERAEEQRHAPAARAQSSRQKRVRAGKLFLIMMSAKSASHPQEFATVLQEDACVRSAARTNWCNPACRAWTPRRFGMSI